MPVTIDLGSVNAVGFLGDRTHLYQMTKNLILQFDEKPGIQAIANTSEDLPPNKNHKTFSHDYEYKRLGTVSLLAGIDLQTGEAIPLVRDKHSSKEYIEILKLLDAKYPKKDKI